MSVSSPPSPLAGPRIGAGAPDSGSDLKGHGGQTEEASDDLSIYQFAPALPDARSAALDAAYEEYLRRIEAGETVSPQEFVATYPLDDRPELFRLLHAHELLRSRQYTDEAFGQYPWPQRGDYIDGLEICQELGRGGFGRVYLIWDAAINRHDVLKVTAGSASEARLAGPLAHPNIVPIQGARQLTEKVHCIRMPLAGCATLASVLNEVFASAGTVPDSADVFRAVGRRKALRQKIPIPDQIPPRDDRAYLDGALAVASELAKGVAFLHERGIRHGDLKPSNVLLSWDGRPIILDFNLADKAVVDLRRVGGTLQYMAPEQLQVMLCVEPVGPYEKKADVFSLGVLLYELFSGRHPFGVPIGLRRKPANDAECRAFAVWLLGQYKSGCPRLTDFVPNLDPGLAQLVHHCLAFDPHDRPSAAELIAAMDRLSSWPRTVARRLRRNRWLLRIAAALLAVQFGLSILGSPIWEPEQARVVADAKNALNRDRPAKAEAMIDTLVNRDKADAAAHFVRGVARMRQNEFASAASDFEKSNELAQDPLTLSCLAYCYARSASQGACLDRANKAEALGYRSPALLSNRAFASFLIAPPAARLAANEQARKDLDEAILRDPKLQSAYFQRAYLVVRRVTEGKDFGDLKLAEDDIDKAIAIGPPATELFQYGALVRALNPERTPQRERQILEFIAKALAHGDDPKVYVKGPAFTFLQKNAEFQTILTTTVGPKPANDVRWSDPLPGRVE